MIASTYSVNFPFMKYEQTEQGRLFEALCKKQKIKWSAFALELDVVPQAMTNWKKRGVPSKFSVKVAERLGCEPGEISATAPLKGLKRIMAGVDKHGWPLGKVPLISSIQAGDWCEAIDNFHPGDAGEWIPAPDNHGPHAYALRVVGTSMEPRLREGEMVVVDPDRDAESGSVVVARKAGTQEVTLKQIIREGGETYLKALNPHWPEPIIRMTEEWHICGRVICKIELF